MIITIDGPAGTGKTTVARRVAEKLGFVYFDTGAMYRAVTYRLLRENVSLENEHGLKEFLTRFQFLIRKEGEQKRYFVDGEDVTEVIRTPEITQRVSAVSAHPFIRTALVAIQRKFATKGNAVFEGRDMGTIVFPKADLKIYLTARPAVRAERRYLEIKDKITTTTQETILQELSERDHLDSTREISPLMQAEDAHLIDTSDITIEEVVKQIIGLVRPNTRTK